jgi:hypothetical protein
MGTEEAEYAFVEQVLQLCEPIDHDPSVVAFLRELYAFIVIFQAAILDMNCS